MWVIFAVSQTLVSFQILKFLQSDCCWCSTLSSIFTFLLTIADSHKQKSYRNNSMEEYKFLYASKVCSKINVAELARLVFFSFSWLATNVQYPFSFNLYVSRMTSFCLLTMFIRLAIKAQDQTKGAIISIFWDKTAKTKSDKKHWNGTANTNVSSSVAVAQGFSSFILNTEWWMLKVSTDLEFQLETILMTLFSCHSQTLK